MLLPHVRCIRARLSVVSSCKLPKRDWLAIIPIAPYSRCLSHLTAFARVSPNRFMHEWPCESLRRWVTKLQSAGSLGGLFFTSVKKDVLMSSYGSCNTRPWCGCLSVLAQAQPRASVCIHPSFLNLLFDFFCRFSIQAIRKLSVYSECFYYEIDTNICLQLRLVKWGGIIRFLHVHYAVFHALVTPWRSWRILSLLKFDLFSAVITGVAQ